jgi:hypothetical protein
VGKRCLVALDTNHIKGYVFATDKLKEIRGASSRLDHLNRRVMRDIADDPALHARRVYTNGGAGLFLIEAGRLAAERFGEEVQQAYRQETEGGASITFAVEDIPDSVVDAWNDPIPDTLELLRIGLARAQNIPPDVIALASHPFLRVCDACGSRSAEARDLRDTDPASQDNRYCAVCIRKREEDIDIKNGIEVLLTRRGGGSAHYNKPLPYAWERVLGLLPPEYSIPANTERPDDFDALGGSATGKDYLAIIYADGNGMGQMMSGLTSLAQIHGLAQIIDDAVYAAMSAAIKTFLPVALDKTPPMFPFDILLIGGDDVVIATTAAVALDVACTLASVFHDQTRGRGPGGQDCSLSVGVVLAPVKYPFGPLEDLAESTLKFAKKEGAKRQQRVQAPSSASNYGNTLINFITVTGSTSPDFKRVYDLLHATSAGPAGRDYTLSATLRPYTVETMQDLLAAISQGKRKGLGRGKLHQVREAVLHMNLSTSVYAGMAVLRNWQPRQRDFVRQQVYSLGNPHHAAPSRAPFPWFADGPDTYRTALLDYVELYDYVSRGEVDDDTFAQEGADDEP